MNDNISKMMNEIRVLNKQEKGESNYDLRELDNMSVMRRRLLLGICGLFMTVAAAMSVSQMRTEAAVVKGTCGSNITWEYNDGKQELTLAGSGSMTDSTYDQSPWKDYKDVIKRVVVGQGITSIGDYAFYNCKTLEYVKLPDGITSIGGDAFSGTGIISMDLPESVTHIEENAFWGCEELVDMELPEGIQFLGSQAFGFCENWENGDVPSGVKEIENAVYQGCAKLESAVIPDGITSVPRNMFEGCQSLRTVDLPDSVTLIGEMAFGGCYSLQNIEIPKGVTEIGRTAFYNCRRLTEITIPDGVTGLSSSIFSGCVALKEVNLHDGITTIGSSVFEDCKALTNITLPKGLEELRSRAFYGCTRLTNIHLPESLESMYDTFDNAKNLFRMTIDSRAVLKAIADSKLDEKIFEYPKTVYIKAEINDALDLTQHGYANAGETDKAGKHYIIYADHAHTETGCTICMTTGIEFQDVKVSDYYYSPIIWAADEGVTTGLTSAAFGPNVGCTRAQVVTFLWRAEDCPKPSARESFVDVPENAYYYDAVNWAAENGITKGYGNGRFGSEDLVTRAQFVSFLWRLKGEEKVTCANPFKDLSKNTYYYDAVLWALEKGITTGLYPDQFAPDATCTRGQVVSFIFRTGQWEVDQWKIVFPG